MNILIVDDHPLTCQGLAALLSASHPEAHVRSAHSASAAREQFTRLPEPDWIFLDIHLPDDPKHQLFKHLCDTHWIERTVLISAEPTHQLIGQALAAGARGFLPKTANADLVRNGFETVLAGDFYLPEALKAQYSPYAKLRQPGAQSEPSAKLSPRLQQIQELLLRGASNKIIARELDLSLHTVKQYVSSVLAYQGVNSRLDLVLKYSSSGLSASRF